MKKTSRKRCASTGLARRTGSDPLHVLRYALNRAEAEKNGCRLADYAPAIRSALNELQTRRYDDQWYEVEHFIPNDRELILLGWVHGKVETVRTGWYTASGWRLSGDIKPRTPPHYYRRLPSICGQNAQVSNSGPEAHA